MTTGPLSKIVFLWLVLISSVQGLGQSIEKETDEGFENPEARQEYWTKMRAGEDGKIPFGALVRAKEDMNILGQAQLRMFNKNGQRAPSDAGIAGWEWLGPGNIGGRIRSILVHPTNPLTMWIGSVSGGIWRTDNGGSSWYPVNDFMANLCVTSIVMDPIDHNVLYASTGEGFGAGNSKPIDAIPGAGIFKSIDGGATWYQLASTASMIWVQRLAHHPDSSGVLLAVNDYSVYKTTDGGTYWFSVYTPAERGADIVYHPHYANNLLLGTFGNVYYSSDFGTSWQPQATGATNKLPMGGGRCEVTFAPSTQLVMYVSMDLNQGQIWKGNFHAQAWTLADSGKNYLQGQGWYGNAIWVDPLDPDIIVRGGMGTSRSTDGGSTWTDISPPHEDVHVFVNHPGYDGITNRTLYVGDDGGINFTTDIRTVQKDGWTILNNNLGITQFYGAATAPDGSVMAGGTQDNRQIHYHPGGGTNGWTKGGNTDGDGGFAAINYANTNYIYGEGNYLKIERSVDGGQNYTRKTNGLSDAGTAALWAAPFIIDPSVPSRLYAGGASIWQTNNNADNWFSIRNPLGDGEQCSAMAAIIPGDTPYLWLGYSGGRVSVGTFWGGSWSWTDVGGGVLPSKFVTDIAVNPTNYNEAIVTFGGYDTNNVYRTTNLGSTWSKIRGSAPFAVPAIQVNAVTYNPQNTNWIYLGTDLGVLASEDRGQTWKTTTLYPKNEGPANVQVAELFWQGTDYLIAATHGRGLFRARIYTDIYVDINNGSVYQFGTQAFPFQFIQSAIAGSGNGTRIFINPGDYPQAPLTFTKRGLIIVPNGGVVIH